VSTGSSKSRYLQAVRTECRSALAFALKQRPQNRKRDTGTQTDHRTQHRLMPGYAESRAREEAERDEQSRGRTLVSPVPFSLHFSFLRYLRTQFLHHLSRPETGRTGHAANTTGKIVLIQPVERWHQPCW
jgi:hypothetical protein